MISLTREEWDAQRLTEEGLCGLRDRMKESVALLGDDGKPRIIFSYQPPIPPCNCSPAVRVWLCMNCDGYVSS